MGKVNHFGRLRAKCFTFSIYSTFFLYKLGEKKLIELFLVAKVVQTQSKKDGRCTGKIMKNEGVHL